MSIFLNIKKVISRWRHGRGFGVHSPFAYRFITEVLRQPYGYYAYRELRGDDHSRLVFRIVLALRPASVALVDCPQYKRAVKAAAPKAATVSPDKAALVIMDAAGRSAYNPALGSSRHLILLNHTSSAAWNDYCRAMEAGMTFANRSTVAVAVALPHLPRQDFDVNF